MNASPAAKSAAAAIKWVSTFIFNQSTIRGTQGQGMLSNSEAIATYSFTRLAWTRVAIKAMTQLRPPHGDGLRRVPERVQRYLHFIDRLASLTLEEVGDEGCRIWDGYESEDRPAILVHSVKLSELGRRWYGNHNWTTPSTSILLINYLPSHYFDSVIVVSTIELDTGTSVKDGIGSRAFSRCDG